MAMLGQSTGEQRVYLGWYGWCPAPFFGESDRPAGEPEIIDLMTSQYESGTQLKWSDESLFHTKLVKVVQVEGTGKGFAYYDQLQRDQLASLGSLGEQIFLQNTAFTTIVPGKAYLMVIRAAAGATGSDVASISIPHFFDTRYNQPDSTYRLTDECYSIATP